MRRPFLLLWEMMGGRGKRGGGSRETGQGPGCGRVLQRSRGGPRTLQSYDTLPHSSRQRLSGSRSGPPSGLFQHGTGWGTVSLKPVWSPSAKLDRLSQSSVVPRPGSKPGQGKDQPGSIQKILYADPFYLTPTATRTLKVLLKEKPRDGKSETLYILLATAWMISLDYLNSWIKLSLLNWRPLTHCPPSGEGP